MRISIDLHDHRLTDYERHVLRHAMARILGRPDLDAALSVSRPTSPFSRASEAVEDDALNLTAEQARRFEEQADA